MHTRRAFVSMYVIAAVAVICLIALAVIMRNCRKILNPRVPKIVTLGPYEVVSVETGASLTVKTRKRRTKQVILQHIATPAVGEQWHNDSVDSMRTMAGSSVTVQVRRRGLFRSTGPDDTCTSRLEEEALIPAANQTAEGEIQPEEEGVEARDPTEEQVWEWMAWFSIHFDECKRCRQPPTRENTQPFCDVAQQKHDEVFDERIDVRGPLIGTVFGESGICLNLAMIEAGYARCNEGAPKEWVKAEAKAKKLGFGIWSGEENE